MPTLRYYVVQTTFNPGVWIKVDEHEFEQLSELGRIEGVPQGPIDPTVFDTEVSDLLADVNSLSRATIAGIPPDPHTHVSTDISDSGSTGRAVLQSTSQLTARAAIGAGTASTKADVGLGNVDNTSDANKPLSTASTAALAGKVPVPGADPNADRLLFWDDSANAWAYLATGTGISITGTTITGTATPPAASDTVAGIVELATDVETLAGADLTRATTPVGVKAVADTKAALDHTHADPFVYPQRHWDPATSTWSSRPLVPAGVVVTAYSTNYPAATPPPSAFDQDEWHLAKTSAYWPA